MASVLKADEVVSGIIGAVLEDGPTPPTARRLASRLHVAPATLYSAFPALATAYSHARSKLVSEIAGPIVEAFGRSDSTALVAHLLDNPNRAVFLTDPGYPLQLNPMIENSLQRIGVGPSEVADLLAVIGSLFWIGDNTVDRVTPSAVDSLVAHYKDSIAVKGSERERSRTTDISAADVDHVLSLVDRRVEGDEQSSGARLAHTVSARLVARVHDADWSFRELGRRTEIPVTRLHRYGSRLQHLKATNLYLLGAIWEWSNQGTVGPTIAAERTIAFLMRSGAQQTVIELYRECRYRQPSRETPEFEGLFAGLIPPAVAAVLAARASEPTDVGETVAIAGHMLNTLAA